MSKSAPGKTTDPAEAAELSDAPEAPIAAGVPVAGSVAELAELMSEEAERLGIELGEVELLVTQAKAEASRHETRRVTASDKLAAMIQSAASSGGPPPDTAELNAQLVLLTKRAALMESQVDVLEGKQRALTRFRDGLARYAETLGTFPDAAPAAAGKGSAAT